MEHDVEAFMTNRTHFDEQLDQCQSTANIPEDMRTIIWKALQPTPAMANVKTELAIIFATNPTYEEFTQAIEYSPNGTAPGMSDITYNMLKAWPDNAKRKAYEALTTLWESKTIPEHFKWRYQCLKPKTTDAYPAADELRPLTLLDSLRKTWERLILNIIQKTCMKHGSYQSNQHCRPQNGTDVALLTLRATLEKAQNVKEHIKITSWDMKKAFDSVSKPNLMMAWMRQGVPRDVAQWIVNLDTEGLTLIRTPIAKAAWKAHIRRFQRPKPTKQLPKSFSPVRGTAQGAVLSPENWNALFDTLLRALEIAAEESPQLNTALRKLLNRDIAFADDLFSTTTETSHMQKKGQIISAFTLIFGLDIATQKLRAFHINYNDKQGVYTRGRRPISINIYKSGWTPHEIQLINPPPRAKYEPAHLTYLGIPIDLNNTTNALFDHIKRKAEQTCTLICNARASTKGKLAVLQSHLYGFFNYFLPHLACPLETIRNELDPILSKAYKRITLNPYYYPSALLYAAKEDSGFGFTPPSDLTVALKLKMINRHQAMEERTQMLYTLITANQSPQNTPGNPLQTLPQPPPQSPVDYWMRPVLDLLDEHNMTLTYTRPDIPIPAPTWVTDTVQHLNNTNPTDTQYEAHVDGSWAQRDHNLDNILHNDNSLSPPHTVAASAIILTPTHSQRMDNITIIKFEPYEMPVKSAFTMELLATAACQILSRHLNHPLTSITTDCSSVEKS
jgi:hypothetical protein